MTHTTHHLKAGNPPSVIYVMTERMGDWNPPESWKIITYIMMIHAVHQDKEITVSAQCSMNIVKTIRHELENCDGDYKAVVRRKQHNRRYDCIRTTEFLKNLRKKVLEDPIIKIRVLSREMNISASTMKLALNEDLCYYSYKCRRGQLLAEKARKIV